MINLAKFQNYTVVESTTHRKTIQDGEEYELKLKKVSTPLLVKIIKDSSGKFVPSQSYDIYAKSVGPYSSSNPQNSEDEAMEEIIHNSLSMFKIDEDFSIDDNPDY